MKEGLSYTKYLNTFYIRRCWYDSLVGL